MSSIQSRISKEPAYIPLDDFEKFAFEATGLDLKGTLSPLHFAIIYSNIPMIKILLENRGSSRFHIDSVHQGNTALDLFNQSIKSLSREEKADIIQLFIRNGATASREIINQYGLTLESRTPEGSYKFLSDESGDGLSDKGYQERIFFSQITNQSFLPIHLAAAFANVHMIQTLLDGGADVNAKFYRLENGKLADESQAKTPLEFMAECSRDISPKDLKDALELFLAHGAELNLEIVEALRKNGHTDVLPKEVRLESLYISPPGSPISSINSSPSSVYSSVSIDSPDLSPQASPSARFSFAVLAAHSAASDYSPAHKDSRDKGSLAPGVGESSS